MLDTPLYLDTAATTPVRPEAREAMLPFLGETFGNPSSPHRFGRAAGVAVDRARRAVGVAVGVTPSSVVFTSGGTEANNLAILGAAMAAGDAGGPLRVAVGVADHKSIIAAADAIARLGGEAVMLAVDAKGQPAQEDVLGALDAGVSLISVGLVNNETGLLTNTEWIAEACRDRNVLFHTDAAQAFGKVPIPTGWHLLTVSAHKIGGPKGAGALIMSDTPDLNPLMHGGNQQRGLRPGTEAVPAIVGFARAVELLANDGEETSRTIAALRETFEAELEACVDDVVIHGCGATRAPHITSVAIGGTENESMLVQLDLAGIAASAGSACSTGSVEPSHVLTAMGIAAPVAKATLRFSFGTHLSAEDVRVAARVVGDVARKTRRAAGVDHGG